MQAVSETEQGPWYRHRMLWLVIAIPALTVAGCLLTIYLALSNPDQLVSDPSTDGNGAAVADR